MIGFLLVTLVALTNALPQCPENPSSEPVLLPNPSDCNTYYQCVGNVPILEQCPPGTQWAQELKRCDWPEVAKCKESETPEPPQSTTAATSGPTGSTTSHPTSPYPNECPAEQGPEDVLLPNPKDCHSFFKCLEGNPVLIQCPPGQEWADHLKRCDWPEVANCKVQNSFWSMFF